MRNQRFVEVPSSTKQRARAFRLRHALAVLLLAAVAAWVAPRVRATLDLYDRAVVLADYATCVAGPAGPELVRRRPEDLQEAVRRRIISAMPDDVPLGSCFTLAEKLGVDYPTLKLHQVRAAEFAEYQNDARRRGRYSVAHWALPLGELTDLAGRAWPFVRAGYGAFVVATSHAKQAAPAPSPPVFGWGTGLPATSSVYRSTTAFGDVMVVALGSGAHRRVLLSSNGGVDWAPGGQRLAVELFDRCVAGDEGREFSISKLNDGQRVVVSHGADAAPQVAILGPRESRLAGVSCDGSALIAVLIGEGTQGHRELTLRFCPFRGACRDLDRPPMGGASLDYPADVARMDGDIILARTVGGITRVTSSRDDGRTWSPWIVAYDTSATKVVTGAPFRLLPVGDQLLLYGGSKAGASYPLLVSDDHGASFHAPAPRDTLATTGSTPVSQRR